MYRRAAPTDGSWVERFLRLLLELAEAGGFEIERRADDCKAAAALVKVVIVGTNALWFGHKFMFGVLHCGNNAGVFR